MLNFKIEPTPKRKQFGLKSSNYLVINCHDLKVVAIQVADILGFSQILIFYTHFSEWAQNWRSQFVTSNSERMGLRYAPFCFTEQGVTMLSCVLNSTQAIETNIRIIRVFTKMREMMLTHKDILLKLEQFEKQIVINSDDIQLIFKALKRFLKQPQEPRRQIGYKRISEV